MGNTTDFEYLYRNCRSGDDVKIRSQVLVAMSWNLDSNSRKKVFMFKEVWFDNQKFVGWIKGDEPDTKEIWVKIIKIND